MVRARWSEAQAIEIFAKALATKDPRVLVGIGDDAAVLKAPRSPLVFTIDTSVENVHFDRAWLSLEDIGYRATMAAVSDLAGMAAAPLAAIANITLPAAIGKRDLTAIAQGQRQAARACDLPIVGGNLAKGPVLEITTAVLGTAQSPLLRSGARPMDEVWLDGDLGLARAGLLLLARRGKKRKTHARAVESFCRPRARLAEGLKLAQRAHAGCDVSDGLSRDAEHLAFASSVRIVIREQELERTFPAELHAAAKELGTSALALALEGGEDYALLCTGPAAKRPRFARPIGVVERGSGAFLERTSGKRARLEGGFDHLATRRANTKKG